MNFIIIPTIVYKNKNLTKTETSLMGLIISLTTNKEYCYASNGYFANELDVSKRTISEALSKLKNIDYIEIEYVDFKRRIYNKVWNASSRGIEKNFYPPIEDIFYHNINNENKKNNIDNKLPNWFNNYDNLQKEPITNENDKKFLEELEKEYN